MKQPIATEIFILLNLNILHSLHKNTHPKLENFQTLRVFKHTALLAVVGHFMVVGAPPKISICVLLGRVVTRR